jgi:hypothetical protein
MRDAGVPSLVVSSDPTPGIERICDDLASALEGERRLAPDAGHFVSAAKGFPELERFLLASGPVS